VSRSKSNVFFKFSPHVKPFTLLVLYYIIFILVGDVKMKRVIHFCQVPKGGHRFHPLVEKITTRAIHQENYSVHWSVVRR
jgi:hypothetical protein